MLYSSHCVCDIVAQEIHVDDNESSFRREREVIVNEECIVGLIYGQVTVCN